MPATISTDVVLSSLNSLGATVRLSADSLENLGSVFEDVRKYAVRVALETLREVQVQSPAMRDPTVYVDGKKGKPVADVKLFGTITMVAPYGPVQEAVQLAQEIVAERCGGFANPTGFYARHFAWYMNGDAVGGNRSPNVARMGRRGNVQLVNTAGYAAMPEIFLPDAVIYDAYRRLSRLFRDRIALSFSYAPSQAFGQAWPDGRKSRPFLAVPVLTIGHPSAAFKRRASRPGVRQRRRVRDAKREAAR